MSSLPPPPPPPPDDGSLQLPDNAKITSPAAKMDPKTLEFQLQPDKPLHGKLLQRVRSRLDLSFRNQSLRYDSWDRADEKRRLYVNLARPARRGDNTTDINKVEMPFQRSIVMPVTYAIHETRKAKMASQFFFRAPFTQLDGRGIEDVKPAKMAEVKLEYDYQQSDGPLAVYSVIQDADAYGVGILYDHWDEVPGWKQVPPDPMMASMAQGMGLPPPEPTMEWGVLKQFTRWSPVDPYMAWPDPRVTRGRLQEGEFFGHRAFRSFFWLLERSMENGGNYINIAELKKQGAGSQGSQGDTRIAQRNRAMEAQQFRLKDAADESDKGYFVIDNFQIKLIPKDWGLGDGDKPEIWWVSMADERIIIRCHRSAYMHNEFTYACAETNFDIHQYANPGIVENLDGMQRTIDWLVNSRIDNVRKFLNDMLIFSPELIEEDDVLHPGSARWIRLTQQGTLAAMQGLDINNMIRQFQVQDVTGAHFEITQFLMDMANKLGSANDTMQGQELPEKRTLGEINNAVQSGSERISVTSKIIDAMVFKPLGLRAIANAQQFYDLDQWVRVVGDYAEIDPDSLGRMQISRADLAGNFDYIPMTALTPQDPARMLSVWNQLYDMAIQNPALSTPDPLDASVLSMKDLFKFVARLGGAREVDTFFKQLPQMMPQPGAPPGSGAPGVLPDQQIEQGVQAGNLVPMASNMGGAAQPMG
jgi:hypothetical protein